MSNLDQLAASVAAAPEDMAPRRAFAAAVKTSDAERARLIEMQLDFRDRRRRGEEPSSDETIAARDLVKKRGRAWAGKLADQVDYFMFWGGFVEEIELDAPKLISTGANFAKVAPLRHLRVRSLSGHIGSVASLPLLRQIRSLDVASNRLRDVDIAEIVSSPNVRGVRLLRINNNPDVGLDALRAIARANLPNLQFVEAGQTEAPLVIRSSDYDGSYADVQWTRARATLVDEFGHLPWLDAREEPSPDAI
jgi:hypothetical protein